MTQTQSIGQATGGKPINLSQLQDELVAVGVDCSDGLGMMDTYVFTYDVDGVPADFRAGQQATVDQAIADHVAMRDKSDAEYATEFQDASTTPERQVNINHIMTGLMPREQVPM